MAVAYTRLAGGGDNRGEANGPALPADGRPLRQFLDNLPRGNPKQTAKLLLDAIRSSEKLKKSGSDRLNQLEATRSVVIDSVAWLENQFIGSPLPLTQERKNCALLALELEVALADGYRMACVELCAPKGSIPLLKSGAVSTVLVRALWHYQRTLLTSWKLYHSPPAGAWQGLHRTYQFALELGVQNKESTDPIIGRALQPHSLYTETVVLSLMNPLAYAQPELDALMKLAHAFSPSCVVTPGRTSEKQVVLPLLEDLPPDCELPEEASAFLDFSQLQQAINDALFVGEGDEAEVTVNNLRIAVARSALRRCQRAFGLASARGASRLVDEYSIETVTGLHALHFFASGRLDFEDFIQKISQSGQQGLSMSADWMSSKSDAQQMKVQKAVVLDHSLNGYRLRWPGDVPNRIRIGEIIGLNAAPPELESDWMVGSIRWLRYEDDGSISAGIKLLTRRCSAVGIRQNQDGRVGQLQRGLELPALDENMPRRFLMAGKAESAAPRIDVMFGYEPYRMSAPRILEPVNARARAMVSNVDYTLLEERVG
jgi:hypothetical protein